VGVGLCPSRYIFLREELPRFPLKNPGFLNDRESMSFSIYQIFLPEKERNFGVVPPWKKESSEGLMSFLAGETRLKSR